MTQYGKITSYDAKYGEGMISPENGGNAVPFDKTGLQQQAQDPRSDLLYSYETRPGVSGYPQAFNLQMEQGIDNSFQQNGGPNAGQGGFNQQGTSENRENQARASRPGVDEGSDLPSTEHYDERGTSDNQPHSGSEFRPLQQEQSANDRNRQDRETPARNPQRENNRDSGPQG